MISISLTTTQIDEEPEFDLEHEVEIDPIDEDWDMLGCPVGIAQ